MTGPTGQETVRERDRFVLPWGKELVVQDVTFDSGLRLIRLRLREGHRFTIVDLDAETADRVIGALASWRGAAPALD